MQLSELVACSTAVAAVRARSKKTGTIGALLAAAPAAERALAALYLAGQLRQARLGAGHAQIGAALGTAPARAPSLSLRDVDDALAAIAALHGAGSARGRQQALAQLFGRATAEEQQFLAGLLTGELRQGALE